MTYRWLEPDEFSRLDSIFERRGWIPLNRATSRVLVAEEYGHIVAFECMQLIPHLGPLHVQPEMRGQGIAQELNRQMLNFLREADARGFLVVADSPFVRQFCDLHGMEEVSSPLYMSRGVPADA